MKFASARVVQRGKRIYSIRLSEIANKSDFLKIKEHLFCPTDSCNARLVYNRRGDGTVYLSTHKFDEHDESCIYVNEGDQPVRSQIEIDEINASLNESAIKSRLKGAAAALLGSIISVVGKTTVGIMEPILL
ncbi:hypothetical protein [Streptococcus massiliensis]|uniref:Uncharacterized protein n=2 Tax=Streptococcus massiliensis TaxID=313439 RepID=A0A380L1S2_9STRE|nr:hypothetical protein [Streptococcus massiliensis]SUN77315.1 Uncharacterised protein [Streptococcus massiliensis]